MKMKGETIWDLELLISARPGIPEHLFYEGKVLAGSCSLSHPDITSDSHVHMCARLPGSVGGGRVPIKGEWNGQSCGMIGCWPTKHHCFRCGTPRNPRNGGPLEAHREVLHKSTVRQDVPFQHPTEALHLLQPPVQTVKEDDMSLLIAPASAQAAGESHEPGGIEVCSTSSKGGLVGKSVVRGKRQA